MTTNASFSLKKWYLDGVSEDGRTVICYSARMSWHGMAAQYAGYLYLRAPGDRRSESRFRNAYEPVAEGANIRWQDSGFNIRGEWESAAPPVRAMLHDSDEGSLNWHCHQPVAKCRIELGNEPPIAGWGYVECLEMTIPPWKMGFNELRWGRFAHPNAPIVWIDLRGNPNRSWVFDGQNSVSSSMVSDEKISISDSRKTLIMSNPTAIEDTTKIMEVVRSLVAWLPGFDRFTPLHFLQARETKWRSLGTLEAQGQAVRTGWVIHELVKF